MADDVLELVTLTQCLAQFAILIAQLADFQRLLDNYRENFGNQYLIVSIKYRFN